MDVRLAPSAVRPAESLKSGPPVLSQEFVVGVLEQLARGVVSAEDQERALGWLSDFQGSSKEVDKPRIDYTSERISALVKEHGLIADQARTFMEGLTGDEAWPHCTAPKRKSCHPGLPTGSSDPAVQADKTRISDTVATHIDYVMASRDDMKPSQATKVLRLWPAHFADYCLFKPSLEESEIKAFLGTNTKDLDKVVNRNEARKRSIEASRAHAMLGQYSIKYGALVDSMAHVVDAAAGTANSSLDAALDSIRDDVEVDPEQIVTDQGGPRCVPVGVFGEHVRGFCWFYLS